MRGVCAHAWWCRGRRMLAASAARCVGCGSRLDVAEEVGAAGGASFWASWGHATCRHTRRVLGAGGRRPSGRRCRWRRWVDGRRRKRRGPLGRWRGDGRWLTAGDEAPRWAHATGGLRAAVPRAMLAIAAGFERSCRGERGICGSPCGSRRRAAAEEASVDPRRFWVIRAGGQRSSALRGGVVRGGGFVGVVGGVVTVAALFGRRRAAGFRSRRCG